MLLTMIFIADIILKYVLAYILTQFKSSVSTILQPGQSHLFIKKSIYLEIKMLLTLLNLWKNTRQHGVKAIILSRNRGKQQN